MIRLALKGQSVAGWPVVRQWRLRCWSLAKACRTFWTSSVASARMSCPSDIQRAGGAQPVPGGGVFGVSQIDLPTARGGSLEREPTGCPGRG